ESVQRSFKEESFSQRGQHYTLEDWRAEPEPVQRPHVPVIVGGRGGPKSLQLCARWGDEYNTVFVGPDRCAEVRSLLERAFEAEGRDPAEVRLSLMTGVVVGVDQDDLVRRAGVVAAKRGGGEARALLASVESEWITGTVDQA